MSEKKSYLEQLQDLRDNDDNKVAQTKIDNYFGFGIKKKAERKKAKRKRFLDEEEEI